MAAVRMTHMHPREHDEFKKALEEARRAAGGDPDVLDFDDPREFFRDTAEKRPAPDFYGAIDRLTAVLRSYIPSGLLARMYAEAGSRAGEAAPEPPKAAGPPPAPPPLTEATLKSDAETVADELQLTPDMTPEDLTRVRRAFALMNHPDRVAAPRRELATQRMTIANAMIDEALRGRKAQSE